MASPLVFWLHPGAASRFPTWMGSEAGERSGLAGGGEGEKLASVSVRPGRMAVLPSRALAHSLYVPVGEVSAGLPRERAGSWSG